MGGDLGVSSTRGVGSQFWFSLNVQLTRQSAVMRAISAPPPLDPELPPARILVAEDNVFTQVLMRRTLESMGHTVDVVGRGDEALKLTKKREYDAILLDCQMPVMDGYETARRIRQRDESTPIIAVTANAVVGDRDKCLAASMNDYVSKPFSIHDVRRVLQHLPPRRRSIQQRQKLLIACQCRLISVGGFGLLRRQPQIVNLRGAFARLPKVMGKGGVVRSQLSRVTLLQPGGNGKMGLLPHCRVKLCQQPLTQLVMTKLPAQPAVGAFQHGGVGAVG